MTTYKVTKNQTDKADKYYTDLMKALSTKEFLKKVKKDGYTYHIFGLTPNIDDWFKLEWNYEENKRRYLEFVKIKRI